jgi:hypothetical protein
MRRESENVTIQTLDHLVNSNYNIILKNDLNLKC